MNKPWPIRALLVSLVIGTQGVRADDDIQDSCSGSSALLAILDRPTVSDSACVVQYGQAVLEAGYEHADLTGAGGGTADNFPAAELRLGLPGNNEFVLLPPNDNLQHIPSSPHLQGFSATMVDIKRGFFLLSAGLVTTALVQGFVLWMLAAPIMGLGMALLYPNLVAAMSDLVPPLERGRILGVYGL